MFSVEELVGRLDLDIESRGASEIGGDWARGEFSIELTEFGCEAAGIWLGTAKSIFEILLLF